MNILERFHHIEAFLFDVDGVLTNGEIIIMEDGGMVRTMNVRDGFAMQRAIQEGFRVGIITGGSSQGVVDRLRKLGIEDIYSGVQIKIDAYEDFVGKYGLDEENILYMGDDLPDYEVMRRVGLPACPRDAAPVIANLSHYVSPLDGGAGCVRDVVEKTLRIQEKWRDA
jgi:3-deoxy-D-manno-octulosonate 8-phosphate phosphatase (KDO 8-P phosphatase)